VKLPPKYRFRLYIARGTSNSAQAVANLNAFCLAHLPGRHNIEVVDVFTQQHRALADHIQMTPTLLKLEPGPAQRMVGTLTQTPRLLLVLGLDPTAT
jgi:circadian clock protein KaiB